MMKSDLLNLLRRQPLTVNALCESLGVTRNAVNVQPVSYTHLTLPTKA